MSQGLYREGRLEIFLSPKGYIADQNLYKGKARNFFKSYVEGSPSYFPHISSYFSNFYILKYS